MKTYVNTSINAHRLLKLGDLDVRRVAEENKMLTADEYFYRVEQFIENAPQYADTLNRASDLDEIDAVREILSEIGCGKLAEDIEGACEAIGAGRQTMAEKWFAEIAGNVAMLCERVKIAHVKKKFRAPHAEDDIDGSNCMVTLSEALEYFDYEESMRKLRILAVDDVAIVLNTLTSVLSRHYEVFAIKKASQVESFLRHTTPELFLLDIEMPELNGYDLVHVIRSFEEHQDTPIIFLTGNASMENLKTALSLGACDFITKPINPDVLLEKIAGKIVRKKSF